MKRADVSDHRSRVTTHVLDATSGRPAAGVEVTLERQAGAALAGGHQRLDRRGRPDRRVRAGRPPPGVYRVTFAVGPYFAGRGQRAFYPEVVILFTLDDPDAHYHVPLLLSPYAFSTYRGS